MEKNKITVWVTTYALKLGIQCVEAETCFDISPEMIAYQLPGCYRQCCHHKGSDWHETEAGALARAEEMRAKKLKSLAKQIEVLKNKKIKVIV